MGWGHRQRSFQVRRRAGGWGGGGEPLTSLLAPNGQVQLPGGVVDEAQDQHGAQDEQQLVCVLHGRRSFTWHHPGRLPAATTRDGLGNTPVS